MLFSKSGGESQWYLSAVGLSGGRDSAWRKVTRGEEVIVAVVDSGLDWNHLDFDWNNLWRNRGEIPDNDIDDDGNGYVDDVIGYNFIGGDGKPWDHDGHGTFVTGIIAGTWNGEGIVGINPHARIMVLKALNSFGHTRASYVAEAITYAADNGARIINVSVGGEGLTTVQKKAVAYASAKGALIVIAAGNEGRELADFGIAALPEVITVGASDREGKRVAFSNYGQEIDLISPGIDIVSLRARYTDTLRDIPDAPYQPGSAFIGEDKRYYMAGGTSFSAPIVTGIASLLLSENPSLSALEVKRMLLSSAKDVETPGRDNLSGWGLVDANAALSADPAYFIEASITGVEVEQDAEGRPQVKVIGAANANQLKSIVVELGAGEKPITFKKGSQPLSATVVGDVVGVIPAAEFAGSTVWILRLVVHHEDGSFREARFRLQLG
ncbi:MAG: S8 family serine peptidase [Porticoccaceae bacterium]